MSGETHIRWDAALTALEGLYRDIEKQSLALPGFSLRPMVIVFWNTIKFELCLLLDIFLLLPMNALIFLRNLLPGKWRYRSFSGRYWRYVVTWFWRGEAPSAPFGVIRPLVIFLLVSHFRGRIDGLQRYVLLDDALSDEDRLRIRDKITRLQALWRKPTSTQVIYSYVLPVSGPVVELYKFFFPGSLPPWASLLGALLISYSIGFVVSAFMVKRGLMLGASGRAAYFPGAIAGTGYYGKERELLASLGIQRKEFPLDVALGFVSVGIGLLLASPMLRFYASMGLPMPRTQLDIQFLLQGAIFTLLVGVALYRRNAAARA